MELVARSLDLGYGMTKLSRDVRNGAADCMSFPSVAPVAPERTLGDVLGTRRNTMRVTVEGVDYEVGPDVELVQRAVAVRNMDDLFTKSPAYIALLRGALAYMRRDVIDILVVGLPVAVMKLYRGSLERLCTGEHPVGRDRRVHVRHTKVLAQPHGALLDYAARETDGRRILKQTNLVIDCGFRTFDWLLTAGLKPVEQRSGSVPRGMYDVLRDIAERISQACGAPYYAYSRLDTDLRRGDFTLIDGKQFDLRPAKAAAAHLASDAVTEMRRALQSTSDIDNIVLVGGASHFFRPVIESMLGNRTLVTVKDPEFANVRGFLVAGQEWAASRQAASSLEAQ